MQPDRSNSRSSDLTIRSDTSGGLNEREDNVVVPVTSLDTISCGLLGSVEGF